MGTMFRLFVIVICGLLVGGCSSIFDPGSGGFKIISTSVEPSPVYVNEIAEINMVGKDARNGLHTLEWPDTSFTVSAGELYSSREEALNGESDGQFPAAGGTFIRTYDSAWWIAPSEAQTVTILINFGGAQKTIKVEVLPQP